MPPFSRHLGYEGAHRLLFFRLSISRAAGSRSQLFGLGSVSGVSAIRLKRESSSGRGKPTSNVRGTWYIPICSEVGLGYWDPVSTALSGMWHSQSLKLCQCIDDNLANC